MSRTWCSRCKTVKAPEEFYGDAPWCKACRKKYNKDRYEKDGHTHRKWSGAWNRRQKEEVIRQFGGKCVCCGETELAFLTIEYSNRDGSTHRTLTGNQVYTDLRKRNYPQDEGIQVKRWNCNFASYWGTCPHQLALEVFDVN